MKLLFLVFPIISILLDIDFAVAQTDTIQYEGVKVILQKEHKKNNTCFLFSMGYQLPAWYRVPMIPENSKDMKINGNMKVKVPGWFAGLGIIKTTRTNFEIGILLDYFKSTIPIAYAGQRSTSEWVYEQSGNETSFTDVFEKDIFRISEVISIRATVRYKVPIGKCQIWGGISPGTFAGSIHFSENRKSEPFGTYRETSLGLTFQAGFDYIIKNNKGDDILSLTLFSDLSGPKIEESIISLFEPSWKFINSEGNYAVNPVRLGLSIGIL
jgi:hypothetical protein